MLINSFISKYNIRGKNLASYVTLMGPDNHLAKSFLSFDFESSLLEDKD